MWLSGLPWIPDCLWREPPRDRGEPTFCSKTCLQGLRAAGMLDWMPVDFTIASDLWAAAKSHLNAYEEPLVRSTPPVDSAGYKLNMEYVMKN